MDQQEIRDRCLDVLRYNLGLIDVLAWLPRELFQGYTDIAVRVIPESNPRIYRVFDGGFIEEIDALWYDNDKGEIEVYPLTFESNN